MALSLGSNIDFARGIQVFNQYEYVNIVQETLLRFRGIIRIYMRVYYAL